MELSAMYFGFSFDRKAILAALEDEEKHFSSEAQMKVRVLLACSGAVKVTHAPVAKPANGGKITVSSIRVFSGDRFLRHKTTCRQLYNQQHEQAIRQGYEETLFLNERGEVTEGSISNVFIEKDGRWFTPPVACGLLPGTYRRHLLETMPEAVEKILRLEDLTSANAIYICNAIRGCRKVTLDPAGNA